LAITAVILLKYLFPWRFFGFSTKRSFSFLRIHFLRMNPIYSSNDLEHRSSGSSIRRKIIVGIILCVICINISLPLVCCLGAETTEAPINLLLKYEHEWAYIGSGWNTGSDYTSIGVSTSAQSIPVVLSDQTAFGLLVWVNTTGWHQDGTARLSGDSRIYTIGRTTEEVGAGRFSCWRLNSSNTFICYERHLGVLISYRYQDINWDVFPVTGYQSTITLTESNLNELIPTDDIMLQILLGIGIIGEIAGIIYILSRRLPSGVG
jgi:hypothetical protein